MRSIIILSVFVLLSVFFFSVYSKTTQIQPEPVTDPSTLRRLNCQMNCQNELQDRSPDCIYSCISGKCYRKIFGKLLDPITQKISGDISEKLIQKFEKCAQKERDEL